MNTKNIIFIFLGITVLGLIGWLFYSNSKKTTTAPVSSTGSGNSLNLNLGGIGQTSDGVKTVNDLTAAEYLAIGFSQSEVDAMFS